MIHFDFVELMSSPFSVHCPTKEEAELLFNFLRTETDVLWCNRTALKETNWSGYASRTHYDFGSHSRGLQFGNGAWGRDHSSQLMTVHEFLSMYKTEDDDTCIDLSHIL